MLKNILLAWFVIDAILVITVKKYRQHRIKWLQKESRKKEAALEVEVQEQQSYLHKLSICNGILKLDNFILKGLTDYKLQNDGSLTKLTIEMNIESDILFNQASNNFASDLREYG